MRRNRIHAANPIKVFVVLLTAVGAVLLLTGTRETGRAGAEELPANSVQRSGAAVYGQHCVSCHGADGRSKTARGKRKGAPDLTKSRISFAKGVRIITNGRDRMPAFKDELSETEIQRVNTYVRGLRK